LRSPPASRASIESCSLYRRICPSAAWRRPVGRACWRKMASRDLVRHRRLTTDPTVTGSLLSCKTPLHQLFSKARLTQVGTYAICNWVFDGNRESFVKATDELFLFFLEQQLQNAVSVEEV